MQPFKRLLVKLSGELLGGENIVFSAPYLDALCNAVSALKQSDRELAFVVGGGNIWRGRDAERLKIDSTDADYVGMLATAVNGLMLKSVFESRGIGTELVSSFNIDGIACRKHPSEVRELIKQQVVVFVGGTGMPHLTTDTLAAIRAVEIGADTLVKLTKVDGVYDKDPEKYKDAKKFDRISFDEALKKRLEIMDLAAFELLRDHHISVAVIKGTDPKALTRFVDNPQEGTFVLPTVDV
jgi:uridylate kinase